MSFLYEIFGQVEAAADATVLWELHESSEQLDHGLTGCALLEQVAQARAFLATKNLKKGDRCALLAPNSVDWVALNLAIMAEGLIVVPLYWRQAPAELVTMMKDCSPALICCGDAALRDGIIQHFPDAPPQFLFDEIFASEGSARPKPQI